MNVLRVEKYSIAHNKVLKDVMMLTIIITNDIVVLYCYMDGDESCLNSLEGAHHYFQQNPGHNHKSKLNERVALRLKQA